jgi:transglutaminase-like putative cysteine protease
LQPRLGTRFPPVAVAGGPLQISGPPVRYEVTLEPNNRPWILVLDVADRPPLVPGFETAMTSDLTWVANRPVTDITRYRAESHTRFAQGPTRIAALQPDYLQLPDGYNPRTLQLAAQMRADPALSRGGAAALVGAALQRLRTGGYQYTLDPGVFGPDTADEFWFDRKEGFCEHIASAFVVLMRGMGIPARVVTGYQGGELNPVDGYWVVRQSDAHAWTEVWLAGEGWVRVDPTSAVAPSRIGSLQRLRPPQNAFAAALGGVTPGLALDLRAVWDALNNGWNQRVLNYTQSRQLNLLKGIGFSAPDWIDLSYVLIALIVGVAMGGALWALWDRRERDPWLRLLQRVRARLVARGLDIPASAPPRQIAALVTARFGDRGAPLADWLLALEAQRYARESGTSLRRLQRYMRHIPWPA